MIYVQCCSSEYAAQGLAMFNSLSIELRSPDCMVWVCCDEKLYDRLMSHCTARISPVPISAVEKTIDGLSECRTNRGRSEWFWTLASQVTHYCLETRFDDVTYLDSDLWFWRSPKWIFKELDGCDTAMFDHKFPPLPDGSPNPQYDRALYNVGFNYFRFSVAGRKCCKWWAERVREKCESDMPAYPEFDIPPGRVGDQPWLEGFHKICNTHVFEHPGGAIAPYNVSGVEVKPGGIVGVDGMDWPLIFYHFHEFRCDKKTGKMTRRTGYPLTDEAVELIYEPYERAVEDAAKKLWG